jgi:hypothetical protein
MQKQEKQQQQQQQRHKYIYFKEATGEPYTSRVFLRFCYETLETCAVFWFLQIAEVVNSIDLVL